MKAIRRLCLPLTAILFAGSPAGVGSGQPQTSTGWHHFGSSDQAPATGQSQTGVWRHFGASPVMPRVVSPARESGLVPPGPAPSTVDLEKRMYELINRDRSDPANAAEVGGRLSLLTWNDRLAAVARAHSLDMLNRSFFAHVDPEGNTPAMRVKAAGIGWQAVGENIAIYPSVAAAETAFMNEPRNEHNHRSIILSSKYTEVGVGIVQGPDGNYYITQEFIQPPIDLRTAFPK